jgi:hypothetical protein
MFAMSLTVLAALADPVTVVQLRYPAQRTTVTTGSGHVVYYTIAPDAPPELRRAYKVLELAEREVLITESLQLFRLEMVNNERRLEELRTIRMASYIAQTSSPILIFDRDQNPVVDPSLMLVPPESTLKRGIGAALARDATIERAILALDRWVEAHYQLRVTIISLAYSDEATRPIAKRIGWPKDLPVPAAKSTVSQSPAVNSIAGTSTKPPPPAAPPAPVSSKLEAAERAEKLAAAVELVAEERERTARAAERAADAAYRSAAPDDRSAAREAWVRARDEWEAARREWDAARAKWQTARDAVEAARPRPR